VTGAPEDLTAAARGDGSAGIVAMPGRSDDPRGAGTGSRRRSVAWLDAGAIFAGWVGLGTALVIAISVELIVAVQPLVFLLAPLAGLLVGAYANVRSERWRPAGRVLLNAGYAGLVTGLGMAVIYAALRLLFVFADTGYRPEGAGGQLTCVAGPACTYLRYVEDGGAADLAAVGVTDGATFADYVLREQLTAAIILVALTLAGALVAGVFRAVSAPRARVAASSATGPGAATSDATGTPGETAPGE
jgi:hypothetical protein